MSNLTFTSKHICVHNNASFSSNVSVIIPQIRTRNNSLSDGHDIIPSNENAVLAGPAEVNMNGLVSMPF
jgi:hypothetical protein